jgi:F-type H+-transporting ATPase subunit delta
VRVLIETDRIALAPQVLEIYEQRRHDAEGVATRASRARCRCPTTSSRPVAALERRFHRKIEATVEVNPSLIGGARITVGDTVIDDSVLGKLTAMKNQLTA